MMSVYTTDELEDMALAKLGNYGEYKLYVLNPYKPSLENSLVRNKSGNICRICNISNNVKRQILKDFI